MVLVAPDPTRRMRSEVTRGGAAGDELLLLLRNGRGHRPCFDPRLAGGLRAWLEDAAWSVSARRGEAVPPLSVGSARLFADHSDRSDRVGCADPWTSAHERGLRGASASAAESASAEESAAADECGDLRRPGSSPTVEIVASRLVHALFRHLVTGGILSDPLSDALDALRVDGTALEILRRAESLTPAARAALAHTVTVHAGHLSRLLPPLASGWMPRTVDRVAIPLCGGRVVLHGVFDLLIGVPRPGVATLCAVGLSTGGSSRCGRRVLHYLALLETLRSGMPPFRVALLDSATGRSEVEDVCEEHVRAMAAHVVAWLEGHVDGCA